MPDARTAFVHGGESSARLTVPLLAGLSIELSGSGEVLRYTESGLQHSRVLETARGFVRLAGVLVERRRDRVVSRNARARVMQHPEPDTADLDLGGTGSPEQLGCTSEILC